MIIRGTTPTHTFSLPFDVDMIKEVRVIYAQDDQIVFVKNTKDCTLANNTVTVKLTQENTFALDCKKYVEIQVRVLTVDGDALVSEIITISVGRCFDKDVIG